MLKSNIITSSIIIRNFIHVKLEVSDSKCVKKFWKVVDYYRKFRSLPIHCLQDLYSRIKVILPRVQKPEIQETSSPVDWSCLSNSNWFKKSSADRFRIQRSYDREMFFFFTSKSFFDFCSSSDLDYYYCKYFHFHECWSSLIGENAHREKEAIVSESLSSFEYNERMWDTLSLNGWINERNQNTCKHLFNHLYFAILTHYFIAGINAELGFISTSSNVKKLVDITYACHTRKNPLNKNWRQGKMIFEKYRRFLWSTYKLKKW